jgi:hypothetical protein
MQPIELSDDEHIIAGLHESRSRRYRSRHAGCMPSVVIVGHHRGIPIRRDMS